MLAMYWHKSLHLQYVETYGIKHRTLHNLPYTWIGILCTWKMRWFVLHYSVPFLGFADSSVTPWSRVLLEMLRVTQLVKKFPAFYETRSFITVSEGCFLRWGVVMLASRPNPKLEYHPLSAVSDCLFNIFAATFHIWGMSRPSAIRGRAILWWQGPT
jgi:hypothetical protein